MMCILVRTLALQHDLHRSHRFIGCTQKHALEERCEFYEEDNQRLRVLSNEQPHTGLFSDWVQKRASKVGQLEALNQELERIICDLEDERRKGRENRKFCAQYHGKYGTPRIIT
jgi:hypothetical protein